ncbi:MAG: hypothetical protein AAF560_15440 [Acidobacteriota bacterium]
MHEKPLSWEDDRRCFVTTRNRFFNGKYMSAREFAREQDYFLSRHRLINRLHLGAGIACGLEVEPHPKPGCPGWVVVRAGVAVDGWGRELILREDTAFEVPDLASEGEMLIGLRYVEETVETVPVLYAEEGQHRKEANWVRENVCLEAFPLDEASGCWPTADGVYTAGVAGACLEAKPPCGDRVPLALLRFHKVEGQIIDLTGRRQLPTPGPDLTRIVGCSWTHGASMPLHELRNAGGSLEIRFDRPLAASSADGDESGGVGIDRNTFLVHIGRPGGEQIPAISADGAPPEANGSRALFRLATSYFEGEGSLAGQTIFVTLHCDFILDNQGHSVDGNHLGGRLPSGNGSPGGTFRSWFHIEEEG